jgi:hypothetical protein
MPKVVPDAGGQIDAPDVQDKPDAGQPKPSDQAKKPSAPPASPVDYVSAIENDYKKHYAALGSDNMAGADAALEAALFKFKTATPDEKAEAAKKVAEEYAALIASLNQTLGTRGKSLAEIASEKSKIASATDQLEKVAQDFLWKWLGKTRHGLSGSMTSGYRLDLYKAAEEMRVELNKMMDSLEKGMDLEELLNIASEIHRQLASMKGLTRALHAAMPKPKVKGKGQKSDPFSSIF